MDGYRLPPPYVHEPPDETSNALSGLEFPGTMEPDAGQVTRNYFALLLPCAAIVGFLLVSLFRFGDFCWLLLLPIAAYTMCGSNRVFLVPVVAAAGAGFLCGMGIIHYFVPVLCLCHFCSDFSDHYLWFSTAAPVPMERGRALRDRHRVGTRRMAALFAVVIVSLGFSLAELDSAHTQQLILAWMFLACVPIAVPMIFWRFIRHHRHLWSGFGNAWKCWFGYNTGDAEATGLLTTPAGPTKRRVINTCLVVIALSVLVARPFVEGMPSATSSIHAPTEVQINEERERQFIAIPIIATVAYVVGAPLLLLFMGIAIVAGPSLANAHRSRMQFSNLPPEEQHRALMERIERSFRSPERSGD